MTLRFYAFLFLLLFSSRVSLATEKHESCSGVLTSPLQVTSDIDPIDIYIRKQKIKNGWLSHLATIGKEILLSLESSAITNQDIKNIDKGIEKINIGLKKPTASIKIIQSLGAKTIIVEDKVLQPSLPNIRSLGSEYIPYYNLVEMANREQNQEQNLAILLELLYVSHALDKSGLNKSIKKNVYEALESLHLPKSISSMFLWGLESFKLKSILYKAERKWESFFNSDGIKEEVFSQLNSNLATEGFTVKFDNELSVEVFSLWSPDKASKLPHEVKSGLNVLNTLYNDQGTNTVENIFDKMEEFKNRPVFFILARNPEKKLVGMQALIGGSKRFPTSVAQFLTIPEEGQHFEIGRTFVSESRLDVLSALALSSTLILAREGLPLSWPIYFWADSPPARRVFRRSGATEVESNKKNIWVFKNKFEEYLKNFFPR